MIIDVTFSSLRHTEYAQWQSPGSHGVERMNRHADRFRCLVAETVNQFDRDRLQYQLVGIRMERFDPPDN